MIRYDNHPSGRHFLQIPGPTNVPDRVLRAIDHPTIDHRGPEFARLGRSILDRIGAVFGTREPVVIYAGSGTGAWEAALVNTLSAGDTVLMAETGHFALLGKRRAERLQLRPEFLPGDLRHGADVAAIEARLRDDAAPANPILINDYRADAWRVVHAVEAVTGDARLVESGELRRLLADAS